jgi:transposase
MASFSYRSTTREEDAMKITTLEDRLHIVELARSGHTAPQIAEVTGWSLATVRKWQHRVRQQGRSALSSALGRPTRGALSAFAPELRATLHRWREDHPGWGAKTLRAELEAHPQFREQRLPSRRSIARFLQLEGLSRLRQSHHELPAPLRPPLHAPHEEWEMDARGEERVPGVGLVMLIDLNDRLSHVRLLSYPCWVGDQRVTRAPTTADYQLALRLAFSEWGLPDRIAVDHDVVFYDSRSASPFPTRLHLWLLALDVGLVFGPLGRATERGLTERSHQLWGAQVLEGQQFADWSALYQALVARRQFLNERLPCERLGDLPPLVAYPQARTPRREYRPEWEAQALDLARIYSYLAPCRWFRLVSSIGTVTLGGQVYGLGRAWAKQQVEITFEPSNQQLVFRVAQEAPIKRLPIQGMTVSALLGELEPLVTLPAFQLALPMTWEAWRMLRLNDTLGAMT